MSLRFQELLVQLLSVTVAPLGLEFSLAGLRLDEEEITGHAGKKVNEAVHMQDESHFHKMRKTKSFNKQPEQHFLFDTQKSLANAKARAHERGTCSAVRTK
jgi:hypothetical protein